MEEKGAPRNFRKHVGQIEARPEPNRVGGMTRRVKEFLQKWSIDSESLFWPSGGLWGSFGARFWALFDFIFGLLRPEAGFLKIMLPLEREHDFRGSGKPKRILTLVRKQLPAATWLQERLGCL